MDGKKKTASETVPRQGGEPNRDSATQMAVGKRSSKREIRCFNCKETGHMARDCPSNALFGEEQGMLGIKHSGVVEGKAVEDIMCWIQVVLEQWCGEIWCQEKSYWRADVQWCVVHMGIQW